MRTISSVYVSQTAGTSVTPVPLQTSQFFEISVGHHSGQVTVCIPLSRETTNHIASPNFTISFATAYSTSLRQRHFFLFRGSSFPIATISCSMQEWTFDCLMSPFCGSLAGCPVPTNFFYGACPLNLNPSRQR